mgnify:CR=1 FL=1
MEKDNRKYRICFIDYMWYVAEIWHERERTNLNGRMLLFWCWLFVLLIPLGFPPILRLFVDDWFGHSDSSLLSSRFILQATLYSRTA